MVAQLKREHKKQHQMTFSPLGPAAPGAPVSPCERETKHNISRKPSQSCGDSRSSSKPGRVGGGRGVRLVPAGFTFSPEGQEQFAWGPLCCSTAVGVGVGMGTGGGSVTTTLGHCPESSLGYTRNSDMQVQCAIFWLDFWFRSW